MPGRWLRGGTAIVLMLSVSLAGAQLPPTDQGQPVQDLGITGALRLDYYRSSKAFDDERDFAGATLQFKAAPTLTADIDAKLSARITSPAIGEGAGARASLIEGFVAVHAERVDLRLGKQVVAWGRADGINPTDNLTPRSYTLLLPFEDDQRIGATGARLDIAVSQEYTFMLFIAPFFEPSRIPLPRGARFAEQRPGGAQTGVRLNKVGEGLDWSASYFHGNSLLPTLRPSAPGATGGVMAYDRISVVGADFARNFGRFGFRGEIAYLRSEDRAGSDPFARNPQLYWVLGVDRTLFDNLNLNLQYFERRVQAYRPPELLSAEMERALALQSALLAGQRDRINSGITLRVSDKWLNDTLEAEIFLIRNSKRRDVFVRPLVTYALTDQWKGTIGIEYYRGTPDTQFGGQVPNRGAFIELRYSF